MTADTKTIDFTLGTFPSLLILGFASWGVIDATMRVIPLVVKLFN